MRRSLWSSQNFNIYIPEESSRWALSSVTTFQLHVQCVRKLHQFSFFPIQIFILIERKCEGALFVLHQLERYKYFREGHSVGQTVVWLSSIYCKPLQRASCFFQKGRSSGIANLTPILLLYFYMRTILLLNLVFVHILTVREFSVLSLLYTPYQRVGRLSM